VSDLVRRLQQTYWDRNQLHALIIELTHRCPARCRHCYVIENPQTDELTTAEVLQLLDQAREEGVFHLMLTGGEVLLRRDLRAILQRAREHRFFVTVLTSGLGLTDEHAAMLADQHVYSVELSLLGASAGVIDGLMRVPGALDRIRQAAARLRGHGIATTLKATIMRPNAHELAAMAELAASLHCQFAASPLVVPRRDGRGDSLELGLDEDELAALDPALLAAGPIPGEDPSGGAVLVCKAGRTVAGVAPNGDVYPCIMWPRPVGNLRERSLRDIWHDHPEPFLQQVRALTEASIQTCPDCTLRPHCRRCPGAAWLESGSLTEPAASHCAGARGMARALRGAPPA
jgi:pyrroloquinoline quinone biosynthesis protein E